MQRSHLSLILGLILDATLLTTAATAQNPTDPPPSQHPILTVTGKGVQIYTCQQTPSGPQWAFQAPEATLTDASGNPVGSHGAGPIWKSLDGSAVKGELLQKSPSPEPTAIPWLLLKAVSPSGSGIMTRVEFIRRSDTHGGIAPITGCDAQHLAVTARVPYTATYTFYSAKP
ncbi:MAG TPA: DUF3455 domain-containing protein [Edaphobacter sp.]|jgi:hypothetical protein|nr:DUF3455 domain-containing protein [Edaphobacter sp.]